MKTMTITEFKHQCQLTPAHLRGMDYMSIHGCITRNADAELKAGGITQKTYDAIIAYRDRILNTWKF